MCIINRILQCITDYWLTLILAALLSGIYFFLGAVPESLYYNQQAIVNGEFWRLFSAHFVHSDTAHLLWNLAALMILSLLLERDKQRLLLLSSITAGIISIDYYLWFNNAGIINYAGFSGVLNTLLVVTLFQQLQKNAYLVILIYFASLAKIIVEIASQQAIFTHISWQAIPQVHLIGFITGTVVVIISIIADYRGFVAIKVARLGAG